MAVRAATSFHDFTPRPDFSTFSSKVGQLEKQKSTIDKVAKMAETIVKLKEQLRKVKKPSRHRESVMQNQVVDVEDKKPTRRKSAPPAIKL